MVSELEPDTTAEAKTEMLADTKTDDSVLTGWYSVINWLLKFILADPIDATFLKSVNKADFVETVDLYLRYEPQVALLYAAGMLFFAGGIVGSVLYPQMRRRRYCGGDRTQDLNENMRCILQVYTAAYIVVLACILLGAMLMLASIFELSQSSTRHEGRYEDYLADVRTFIESMAEVSRAQESVNVDYLTKLHVTLGDFSVALRRHLVPLVKSATAPQAGQSTPSEQAQEMMAEIIATNVSNVYNDSLFESSEIAKNGAARMTKFNRAVLEDVSKSVLSYRNVSAELTKTDQLGILATLRSKSHWYIFVVLGSFLFLFVLYTGSFIMGMFHYNEDIPPTKRTDASNYAGTAMLVTATLSLRALQLGAANTVHQYASEVSRNKRRNRHLMKTICSNLFNLYKTTGSNSIILTFFNSTWQE